MHGFNKQSKKINLNDLRKIRRQNVYKLTLSTESLPDTVDWVKDGWVNPVQFQVSGFIYIYKIVSKKIY